MAAYAAFALKGVEPSMVRAIVGANWGDEGKGKITDMLASESDIVVRFQGGANAGHTIINDYGRFALHLLPSGVCTPGVVNVLGPGVALDIEFFLKELAAIRREGKVMTYLRPDAKSQVTIEYDDNGAPVRIDTIVVSTQHDDFIQPEDDSQAAQLKADEEMLSIIRRDVIEILMPRVIASIHHDKVLALFNDQIVYHVNPTGKFVIGGPHGDTGLTGRKIIVDTYGGKGAHGGGAFSGKDPSKVDRSAAYAARHIAKNMVAAGVADEMLVQVSYAIGVARPINIFVDTYGRSHVNMTDGEIARVIDQLFDLRPKAIEERLKLRNPIYQETAAYGHMGREPQVVSKTFFSRYEGNKTVEVELFTWEKLDYVDKIKAAFGL